MTDPTKPFSIEGLSLRLGEEEAASSQGNQVMQLWFQLFRTAQIHQLDNQALQRPIAAWVEMTNTLVPKEGRVAL
ncbi:MAG TPA: hypothetical protein VI391_05965, partial [Thermoanaerobaculia bacterium]